MLLICRLSAVAICSLSLFAPAQAQRSADNALRSAQDAFGSSMGRESIGLYNSGNVRGFSPAAAGNIRLEGLYIDIIDDLNGTLVRGSTVRVGISAQGYPFPAPTGVADFRLATVGDRRVLSVAGYGDSHGTALAELNLELPIAEGLGLSSGLTLSRNGFTYAEEAAPHAAAAAVLRWQPSPSLEIIPFWSGQAHSDDATAPRFIVNGTFLPPKIDRHRDISQNWTSRDAYDGSYGTIARWSGDSFAVQAGVFRTLRHNEEGFSDQFLNVSPTGLAERHRISRSPSQKSASTSGEVRVSKELEEGSRRHRFLMSARGRHQQRRYGGSAPVEFGPAQIGVAERLPQPFFAFGPQSQDTVKQVSGGIAYEGLWPRVGELSFGLQKTDYSKTVVAPGQLKVVTRAQPWLYYGGIALHLSEAVAVYGGFTRGLEESSVAPDVALNRDEAPPAIRTSQFDGGIRWAINPRLKLIGGIFNVEKPYFNLDNARIYRQLGEVRHRGAEISVVGQLTPDLNLVAGAVLLDASVRGEAVDAGFVGKRPVGSTPRTIIASAEYQIPGVSGLAVDGGINYSGSRFANVDNSLRVPSALGTNLGVRYRWSLGKAAATLRAQVSNVLDSYNWQVIASNTFFYNNPRMLSLRLTTDL